MTAIDIHIELLALQAQNAPADEIEAARAAYVGAAVTEIASFRAQLSGAQHG